MKMNDESIMVSILCTTYNHEKYIGQALESFINQKTNFKFEVIINDDCSTDNTANIIREYEKKYPDIIKPVYQKENQYSKHVKIIQEVLIPKAKGKYLALCEGDDYFIDENKLQKQFDFLESHSEYAFCVHNAIKVNTSREKIGEVHPVKENSDLTCEDFILGGGGFVVTNSIFTHMKYAKNLPDYLKNFSLDYIWQIYFSSKGKTYCFADEMSAYRIGTEGSWSSRMKKDYDKNINHCKRVKNCLQEIDQYTNKKYHKAFKKHILKINLIIMKLKVKKIIKV